jgi:5'-3' exonuclease
MCGTDYNPNIPRIGSKTAYKHILQHGNLEGITKKTKLDTSVLNYERTRELFTVFKPFDVQNIPYCGKPNFPEFQKFLTKNNLQQINQEKLRESFVHNRVVYEDDNEVVLSESE